MSCGRGTRFANGGRVVFANGRGCLVCLDELDHRQIARDRMSPEQGAADDRIYGVDRRALAGTGPMVVSINGVVASLAVTEFICHMTGLREPVTKLIYRAEQGGVRRANDQPAADCYDCSGIWGSGSASSWDDPGLLRVRARPARPLDGELGHPQVRD